MSVCIFRISNGERITWAIAQVILLPLLSLCNRISFMADDHNVWRSKKKKNLCAVFDQVARRLRRSNKGHRANIRRRSGAKHCSSLCLQSEGARILRRPNTAKNPTKICPRALAIFATCSWPSLCEQSELQCWRRNRRLCGPVQISAARALPLTFDISIFPLPITQKEPHTARCMAPFVLISVKRYIIG